MNETDIQQYFDKCVKNYLPYKNEEIYKSIINVLQEYFNDLYNETPDVLKQMYENSQIPQEICDKLLIHVGMTKHLISQLNVWDKLQFLEHLPNFQNYKGTIQLLKDILKVYNNNISAYELYITRENGTWVFKPKVIYYNSLTELIQTNLSFYSIYNKVPNFLLSEMYLENLYQSNNIILPLKSNLLLIDFSNTNSVSIINDLIVSSFLYHYGNQVYTITFDTSFFDVNISLITYTWFYLVSVYFNYDWYKFPENIILHFDSSKSYYPHTLEEIENIISEYENLNLATNTSRRTLDQFYFEHCCQHYQENRKIDTITTKQNMFEYIYNHNKILAEFLQEQIEQNNPQYIIEKILSEFYYTLYRYINQSDDEYFKKYGMIWLIYLPKLIINVNQTPEYRIISETKPYHTDLVESQFSGISVDNKFNSIPIDVTEIEIEIDAGPYTSSIVMSDNYDFTWG